MSVRGRHAALLVVALVVGFQLPGLGRDGLLSDASALRGNALWREDFATVWAGTSDYTRYFAPWAAFIQRALRAGTLPLWNPYVGTGVPVSEALQPALFHPFTLLLVALPVEHALTVLALLRLALAGLGAFVLARVLGCGAPAATLAGVLYGLEPFHLVLRFHTLPNVSACLPWLLALSERRLRAEDRRGTLAAWALVAALACLGGHSQTTMHVLAVAIAYHLLRSRPARIGRELGFLGAGLVLAALGALVALWGHAELVLDGYARAYRALRGVYPRLPVSHLASFLLPGPIGVQVPAYVGLLALALAAGGVAGRAAFPAWPWAVITLVSATTSATASHAAVGSVRGRASSAAANPSDAAAARSDARGGRAPTACHTSALRRTASAIPIVRRARGSPMHSRPRAASTAIPRCTTMRRRE